MWEKNKTSVIILSSGVYRVESSYSGRDSEIALLVNGEPVYISSEGMAGGKIGKTHPMGNLNCSLIFTYLLIPEKSRLSI